MDRVFLLDSIVMNTNTEEGRIFRRKFPPKPRPMNPNLGLMEVGLGVMGGMLLADLLF